MGFHNNTSDSSSNSAPATIQILDDDPATPMNGDTWLLRMTTGSAGKGMGPMGLTYSSPLLDMCYLCYMTGDSIIVRTPMI